MGTLRRASVTTNGAAAKMNLCGNLAQRNALGLKFFHLFIAEPAAGRGSVREAAGGASAYPDLSLAPWPPPVVPSPLSVLSQRRLPP